jgi:two-component system chemotaxis response regulator CheY
MPSPRYGKPDSNQWILSLTILPHSFTVFGGSLILFFACHFGLDCSLETSSSIAFGSFLLHFLAAIITHFFTTKKLYGLLFSDLLNVKVLTHALSRNESATPAPIFTDKTPQDWSEKAESISQDISSVQSKINFESKNYQRDIENQKTVLGGILAHMSEAMLVFDRTGNLVIHSAAAQRLLGNSAPMPHISMWLNAFHIKDLGTGQKGSMHHLQRIFGIHGDHIDDTILSLTSKNHSFQRELIVNTRPIFDTSGMHSGSVIFLSVPSLEMIPNSEPTKALAKDTPNRSLSILIVDDSEFIVSILIDCFSASGHMAKSAATAAIARTLLHKQRWDFVIIDHHLPDHSGVAFTQEVLSQNSQIPSAVVIGISGDTSPLIQEKFLQAGAKACLTKPFSTETLLDIIESHTK